MKKSILLGLALAGLTFACRTADTADSTEASVTTSPEPCCAAKAECGDKAAECDEAKATACDEAKAGDCEKAKVCPVTGKSID